MSKSKKTKSTNVVETKKETKFVQTPTVKPAPIENLKRFENAALAVAHALKSLRQEAGMTQTQLSDASGVSVRTIRRYEGGDPSMTIHTVVKLFDTLGVFVHLELRPVNK